MKEISVLGRTYSLPEIRDESFIGLQEAIGELRGRMEEGSLPKRNRLRKRQPKLGTEARLALMEELVGRYDELVATLRGKIGGCRSAFGHIGEGVRDYFGEKIKELEALEERRSKLADKARAAGQAGVAADFGDEGLRIRALAVNLAKSSVLIIRKLRYALDALDVLVDDEEAQRKVLESLKSGVAVFREAHDLRRDLDRIEEDIEEVTRFALSFETILRDELGPLATLIDQVSSVDSRIAESLEEIKRLSLQLESRKGVEAGIPGLGEAFFDAFVKARLRADSLDAIVSAMGDTETDRAAMAFEVGLAEGGATSNADAGAGGAGIDFAALADNMAGLVRRGLADLGGALPVAAPDKAGKGAVAAMAAPAYLSPRREEEDGEAPADARVKAQEVAASGSATIPPPRKAPGSWAAAAISAASATQESPALPGAGTYAVARSGLAAGSGASGYRAAISRVDPALIVFLLDRSGSMEEGFGSGSTKAEYLARTVDRCLMELATRCTKADGTRDYFHIACLGYGNDQVLDAFDPGPGGAGIVTIGELARSPKRIVETVGGAREASWVDAEAEGSTPMRLAFERACALVASWCDAHPASYPPTVINISDGEATDGDPLPAAEALRRLHTDDGEALVFNLHVSSRSVGEVVFPESPAALDEHGRRLFTMSSPFPPHLLEKARAGGFTVGPASRFFAWGAGAALATRFLELGTRPTRLA
jgi:hypothetical protein